MIDLNPYQYNIDLSTSMSNVTQEVLNNIPVITGPVLTGDSSGGFFDFMGGDSFDASPSGVMHLAELYSGVPSDYGMPKPLPAPAAQSVTGDKSLFNFSWDDWKNSIANSALGVTVGVIGFVIVAGTVVALIFKNTKG